MVKKNNEDKEQTTYDLSDQERRLLLGIESRQNEINRQIQEIPEVKAIAEDRDATAKDIEGRLGLPEGSVGTQYQVDGDTWQLVKVDNVQQLPQSQSQ